MFWLEVECHRILKALRLKRFMYIFTYHDISIVFGTVSKIKFGASFCNFEKYARGLSLIVKEDKNLKYILENMVCCGLVW